MNVCDAASSSVEDPGNDGPPRTKKRELVLEANNQGNCICIPDINWSECSDSLPSHPNYNFVCIYLYIYLCMYVSIYLYHGPARY